MWSVSENKANSAQVKLEVWLSLAIQESEGENKQTWTYMCHIMSIHINAATTVFIFYLNMCYVFYN